MIATRRPLALATLLLTTCLNVSAASPAVATSQVPLTFESVSALSGTADAFSALAPGFRLTLQPQDAVIQLAGTSQRDAVHLRLLGSNIDARPTGVGQLSGSTFHLRGNDPAAWRKAANFARVRYQGVYPGIDLVYYGDQNQLESDFVVAAHADPNQIQFTLAGAQRVQLDSRGNLLVSTKAGEITFGKPHIYQQVDGKNLAIAGVFQLNENRVGFRVGAYDPNFPLVIDPTLSYSAAVSRSLNDKVNAIAVAADGSTYVAGVAPAMKVTDHDEAFVAHISADGKTLLYLTYLGGAGATDARAIALDGGGNAYIAGETKAPDFPVLNAFQVTCSLNTSQQCAGDAFVAKINPDGSLKFATYLGGGDEDAANAIAVDATGGIYVAGSTSSLNFPTAHGPQFASGGGSDAFVAKFSSDGLQLLYATYLGGSGADQAFGIAIDANLNAYVTGQTKSIDFPVKQALQAQCYISASNQCQGEAFLTKISADGSQIAYSTYFGGSGVDSANAIAVDSSGSAFIAGATTSSDFPVANAMQAQLKGKSEAFVAKFLPDASVLVYATFVGGAGDDTATSIALDKSGKVFVSGHTDSPDFPTQAPLQAACHKAATGACSTDAFLAVLNSSGTGLQFSTYLGGSGVDIGSGVAVDAKGSAYLGASSTTSDFPMVASAVMASGSSPSAAKAFGSATALAASPSVTGGGIVTKVSGITPQTACAGTINWTGLAGDNLWATLNNWDTKVLPVSTDSVCIGPTFAGKTITVGSLSVANQTIAILVSNANISLTVGPLAVTGGAQFVGSLSMTGGSLTLNGTNGSSVGSTMALSNSVLAGTDTVAINGLLTWGINGQMCAVAACNAAGTGVTNANGGIAYSPGYLYLSGRTLNNNGTAVFGTTAGYTFTLSNGAVVNNTATGIWNYNNDYPTINGGTFNNAGTLEKTGGTATGVTTINAAFTNTGSVLSQSGTLNLTALTGTSSGSWNAAAGDALILDGGTPIPSLSGNFSGAGALNFSGGTLNMIAGATFTGTGSLAINSGAVVFQTGGAVAISQAVTLIGGVLAGTDTVAINGLLTWGSNGQMCAVAACNAAGTAVTNANGGIAYSPGYIYLNGRSLNNTGTAVFGTTAGYTLTLSNGAVINNTSTGTWNYNDDYPTINGGTFNNAGTLKKTGGTATAVTTINAAFTNTGSVLSQSGTLNLTALTGTSTGSWNAAAGDAVTLDGGTPIPSLSGNFTGAGTVNFSGGTLNVIAGATFTGTGTLAINSGAVVFQTGAAVAISQAVTLTGVLAGTDTVTINGLLIWGSSGQMCAVAACNAAGTGVTNASGGIAYSPGYIYLNGRTLNNTGAAVFGTTAGYTLTLSNGAVINNTSTGTWNYNNDYPTINGGTFNNAGKLLKTGGTATAVTTINAAFTNTGSVLSQSGTLNLTALTGTSTGSWNAAAGDAVTLDGGTPIPSLSGNFTGAGTLNFSGGTLNIIAGATFTGTGTLAINSGAVVFQTGAAVAISQAVTLTGVLAGTDTVSINGLLTWGSSGQMCAVAACNAAGTGITNANGGIAYSPGYIYINGRTLNNTGTAVFGTTAGYTLTLSNGAVINNTSTGTWNYNDDYPTINGGTFNNAGTLKKTGGTATAVTTINAAFTNTGSVLSQSGTLNLTALTGTSTGSWNAAAGDAVTLDGGTPIPSLSGNFTGAGTVNFSGGTLNVIAGATFTGTGTLAINTGALVFQTGAAVAISQAVTLTGVLAGTDTVNLNALLTWGSNGQMCAVAACNAAGTGVTNANGGIAYTPGYIYVNGRTLNNNGTAVFGTTAGYTLTLSNGAVINNTSTGTWNFNNDYPTINGGTFNNAGKLLKTGGTATAVTTINAAFTNTGSVLSQSGTLNLTALTGTSTGSWNAAAGDALIVDGGTPIPSLSGAFLGAGTVNFSGGTLNIIAGATFTGTGTLAINTGAVVFQTGSAVAIAQAVTLTGVLAGPDTVAINGLLTWGSSGQMCAVAACNAAGAGITNANGGIAYSPGYIYLNGRTLNNNGTAVFGTTAGYSLTLSNGAVINNTSTGTWNYNNDYPTINGGTFNNAGTFEKTGGTVTAVTVINAAYTQTAGTTFLGSGGLAFGSSPLIQSGSITGSGNISGNYTGSVSTNPAGIIAPGTSTTAGAIALTGSGSGLYAEGTGALNIKIGGTATGQFDTLAATGTATLAGTLNVSIFNGYTPNSTDKFTILTAGSVVGKFAVLSIPSGWTVTYNPTSVVLNAGTGTAPSVNLSSTTLTFPNTAVGKSAGPLTVTLSNNGNAALTITSIVSSDTANYTYSVDATKPCPISPATLAANASCVLDVTFAPASSGLHSAQITITDNNNGTAGSTQFIALTGTGVVLSSIAVSPATASISVGQTQQFTATGTYSDGSTANLTSSVTWASATPSVATIAATGLASGVAKGASNITATLGSIGSPAAVLTVTSAILQSIAVTPATATISAGQTQQFTATGTYSDGTTANITSTVAWASGTPSVATIAASGLANGIAKGTSNITATLGSIASPTAVLTVTSAILQSIAVTPATATISAGQTQQFTATGTYSDGTTANITSTVTWASSTISVATIAVTGLASGIAKGTSNITATLGSIASPGAVLTVTSAILQSIAITPATATISAGQTQQFTATGTYSDGTTANITSTVTWASSTTSVATIAVTGLASGVSKGTSNITATLGSIASPGAVLTVTSAILQSIAVTPATATISAGQTQQFTATGTYSDGTTANITSTVTWASSTTSVATIAATGLASGIAKGTSNITATLGSIASPGALLTVTSAILQSIAVTPATATISAGQTAQFTATGTYSDGTTANITSTVTWASSTTSVATISATGLASGIVKGTSNITATLGSIASPGAVLTVTSAILQSIAVTPATATISAGQTQQFTATGTYSDGTTANITSTVTWASSTSSVATIASTGLASGIAKGTSNITATLGSIASPGAVLTVTSAILQSIAVTPATATISAGQTAQFTATGTYSDGTTANITSTVAWASGTPSVATIASTGLASGIAKGTSNITATLGSIGSPAAILTVTSAILQSIAVTPASATISAGQTQQFNATGTYSDGTTANITSTVTWASSTSSVATITATGSASGIAKGTSNITATLGSIASPGAVLTVTSAILQSIAVTPSAATISAGQTQQFTATGTYSDGTTANITSTVTWASGTSSVATIAATGLANGIAKGTSNITATLGSIASPGAVLNVTSAILQSIAVTPSAATISAGQTQQFTATGTYSDGTTANITSTATWASSTTSVATIAATGLASGIAKGTSNITAALGSIASPGAVLNVTSAILQSIAITPATATISAGQTQQFTATGTYSDGTTANITSTVTWASSTSSVATIAATGLASGIAKGTSNITAALGSIASPGAVLTVTSAILQSIAVTPATATISAGQTQQFTATGTYSDGTTANITSTVTWASGTTSVATIAATGLASGIAKGTSDITATFGSIASPAAVLTVTSAILQSIAVTPSAATISAGQTQQFTATGTYSDGTTANITSTVTWASSTPSVATISASGLASAIAKGTSNITATLGSIASPGAVLTVTSAILQSIAATPSAATISAGQTQQFTATGTYSDGTTANITSTVAWASSAPSVATIAATGLASGIAKGTSNITATLGSIGSPAAVLTVTSAILQSIAVTPSAATISAGQTQQFTATGTYSDGTTANITSTVAWASSAPSVATIAASGLANGIAKGASNITATLGSIASPGAVLTVTSAILQSIAVTPATATISAGQTQQFTATATYSDGTTANITTTVTWASSAPSVDTISAIGLSSGIAKGTSNITAALGSIASPGAVLTVTSAILQSIVVTPATAMISAGQTQQFTATGTYTDGTTANLTSAVVWISSASSVATISPSGLATGLSAGTTNITATLGSITSAASILTVTSLGEPKINITLLDQSAPSPSFYVDVQVTNTGTGPATNISVSQINFRTLSGSGAVTYNTALSAALPISVGSLNVGSSATLRLYLNVPTTVSRFSVGEGGTVQDASGTVFTYASSQSVAP